MELVQLLIEAMERQPDPEREDDPAAEIQGFWAAAVITYARGFNTGYRRAVAQTVRIPNRFRHIHDWLLSYRNETVAHRSRSPIDHWSNIELWWRQSILPPYWTPEVYPVAVWMLHPTGTRIVRIHRLAGHLAATYASLSDDMREQLRYAVYELGLDHLLQTATRPGRTIHVARAPILPIARRLAPLSESYRPLHADDR